MKIWAHRGCSYKYPENSIPAFAEALEYDICGIETDVQLTKDGRVVCIHDESVSRTTDASGNVRDFTLEELKEISEFIPTLEELLDLLDSAMRGRGVMLNIEFKTDRIRYEGIECMVLNLVKERRLEDYIIYSSFNPDSIKVVKEMRPEARTAVLAKKASKCIELKEQTGADDIHPRMTDLDVPELAKAAKASAVRVWNDAITDPLKQRASSETPERFFPDRGDYLVYYMAKLEGAGVTDYFTNVPEDYCRRIGGTEHS